MHSQAFLAFQEFSMWRRPAQNRRLGALLTPKRRQGFAALEPAHLLDAAFDVLQRLMPEVGIVQRRVMPAAGEQPVMAPLFDDRAAP